MCYDAVARTADSQSTRYPKSRCCQKGNIEAVKQHLATGADVNAKDAGGGTPILDAAYSGQKEIAELLIAAEADVNAKDDDGTTSLDWAITHNADDIEIAGLLRQHGGKTLGELKAEGK